MRLTELDAHLLRAVDDRTDTRVDTLAEAQGVCFQCPKCCHNGGHYVLCWFKDRGIPDDKVPGPGRWTPTGTCIADLSLTPSVLLSGAGCGWHGFVTNGDVSII